MTTDTSERGHEVPKMTSGRAVLIGLMDRYLNGLLDPFVTVLEVHKLMYFMQVAGQRLRLKYGKGLYGPYAENLRQVLNEVEGHFISGYADGGDRPDKRLELVPGAAEDAAKVLRRSRGDPGALRPRDGPCRRVRVGFRARAAIHRALGSRARCASVAG